jgi:hypothetical protein
MLTREGLHRGKEVSRFSLESVKTLLKPGRPGKSRSMILSGHLTADRVDRAAATSALLADLNARRRTAELRVDALVEVWRDQAAHRKQAGWGEMEDAARDAIDSLSALLGAIDLARDELSTAKEMARETARETARVSAADASATGRTVQVPRQTDRRARPWATLPSDRLPGEVSSRPAAR